MSEIMSQAFQSTLKIVREAFESDGDYKAASNASSFKPTARDKWIGTCAMVIMSIFSILLGTYHSVKQWRKAKKGARVESLSQSDVIWAPLFASFTLFSLFYFLKLIPKEYLMTLFSLYVIIYGWFSVGITFDTLLEYLYSPFHTIRRFKLNIMEQTRNSFKEYFKFDFSSGQILSLLIAAVPCLYYLLVKKFWVINNLVGIGLCARMITTVHVNRFHHIAILMCGLFVYDIFWVFFSNVMVFVAKSIDLPIKLLFPSDLLKAGLIKSEHFSMLGLGDIALPGLYLAFLRRFDLSKEITKVSSKKREDPSNPFPYFWPAIIAYIIGLIASSAAVIVYNKAQPALLYLVPSLLITTLIQAALKHEIKDLFAYHDLPSTSAIKDKDDSPKSPRTKSSAAEKSSELDDSGSRAPRTKQRSDTSPRRRTPPRKCNVNNSASSAKL